MSRTDIHERKMKKDKEALDLYLQHEHFSTVAKIMGANYQYTRHRILRALRMARHGHSGPELQLAVKNLDPPSWESVPAEEKSD